MRATGIWSVYLTGRRLDRLRVEAGQFFSWRFVGDRAGRVRTPIHCLRSPAPWGLRITVQGIGDGSGATRWLRPGTRALVEGPYGRLSARARTRPKVAMIGAGVGTTPLRALAEGLPYAPGDAVFMERFSSQPLFASEVDDLARERGLQVLRLPGRRRRPDSWLGNGIGEVDDLGRAAPGFPTSPTATSSSAAPSTGPTWSAHPWQVRVFPADQLHLETFAW